MTPTLNHRNLMLVNQLRNQALGASKDFNALRFFADVDYANATLVELSKSSSAELRALVVSARSALFPPAAALQQPPAPAPPAAKDDGAVQRFVTAKEMMNALVVDAAGLRSFFIVLKLERCSTMPDLVALLGDFERVLGRGAGAIIAAQMTQRMRALLV
jgi:hypothetical protein